MGNGIVACCELFWGTLVLLLLLLLLLLSVARQVADDRVRNDDRWGFGGGSVHVHDKIQPFVRRDRTKSNNNFSSESLIVRESQWQVNFIRLFKELIIFARTHALTRALKPQLQLILKWVLSQLTSYIDFSTAAELVIVTFVPHLWSLRAPSR